MYYTILCFTTIGFVFEWNAYYCGRTLTLVYIPNGSSTSKKVTCNNSLCMHHNQCLGTFSNCPYMVSYVSAETATSGILVEDVLHLTQADDNHDLIEANVVCVG